MVKTSRALSAGLSWRPRVLAPDFHLIISLVCLRWKCEVGRFKNLRAVFESDVLLQIIFYGLHNILVLTNSTGESPPSAEAILDQVSHLVMLALGATFSLYLPRPSPR